MKREPVVCLSVAPRLGGGAGTRRDSARPARPRAQRPGPRSTTAPALGRGRGQQAAHFLTPSPSDSPGFSVQQNAMLKAERGEKGDNGFSFLPKNPLPRKRAPYKTQKRPASLPADGRRAACAGRGHRAPASPGPLHCLFCCQRTYQDVSLLEVLTRPGALPLSPGFPLCFYTCTNSTALPVWIYGPIKGSVFLKPPALLRATAGAGMRGPCRLRATTRSARPPGGAG